MSRKIPMGTIVEMQVTEFGGEAYKLKTHLQDTLRFEQKYSHSPVPDTSGRANMDMMRLAFFAAKRLEVTTAATAEAWMANVDECYAIAPDEKPDEDVDEDELDEFGPYVSAENPTR